MDLFNYQDAIGKNLIYYIRLKGYTITSMSRLFDIPKLDFELIIKGRLSDQALYQVYIDRLTKGLDLPRDYFVKESIDTPERWHSLTTKSGERSPLAQELLDDLDELLSLLPFYINN